MLQLLNELAFSPSWERNFFNDFERFFAPARSVNRTLVNVYGDDENARVVFSLPGWEADWVELTVDNNHLVLTGESKSEDESAPKMKIERSVKLPFRVDSESIEAQFKNGLLTVNLARAEEDKPRKIMISAA